MSLSHPLLQICAPKYFAPELVDGRLWQQCELEEELYSGETAHTGACLERNCGVVELYSSVTSFLQHCGSKRCLLLLGTACADVSGVPSPARSVWAPLAGGQREAGGGGAALCWHSCCARWEERCWHAASENVTSWMLRLEMLICPAWVRIASVYVPISMQSPHAGVRARGAGSELQPPQHCVEPGVWGMAESFCPGFCSDGLAVLHLVAARALSQRIRLAYLFFPCACSLWIDFVLGAKAALLLGNRQQQLGVSVR